MQAKENATEAFYAREGDCGKVRGSEGIPHGNNLGSSLDSTRSSINMTGLGRPQPEAGKKN